MKLYQQLVLFMLAATVLPLVAVGFLVLSRSERALVERVDAEQRTLATVIAEETVAEVLRSVEAVARSAELFDWSRATPEERRGGLILLHGQSVDVSGVLLARADGQVEGEPFFARDASGGHPAFHPDRAAALARAVDLQALANGGRGQAALGPPYAHPESGESAMALAVKLTEGEAPLFAVSELVLRSVASLLRERASGHEVALLDGVGKVLASAGGGGEPGRPMRIARAAVPKGLGMEVRVAIDERVALAPVRALRRTVLLSAGVSVGVLLLVGGLFTRRLNRRLGRVVAGAEAFARGELDQRVSVEGQDELTELASTFNRMGSELEGARARILRWNDDLKARVDEATSELRAAQTQLLEAQKLAAVGQLGAGVAHEINNPLAGILGNAQLLLLERSAEHPDFEALRKIEQSAKRCKEITQNLLRFAQQRPGVREPFDLNRVVRAALAGSAPQLEAEGIRLTSELADEPVRVVADAGQLAQTVQALVANARTAMLKSPRKELTVRTSRVDGHGVVEVVDSGKGILPEHLPRVFEPFFTTKDVWSNVGLGLSVAYRAVQEAGGTLQVASEPGQGAAFTVRLPSAPGQVV